MIETIVASESDVAEPHSVSHVLTNTHIKTEPLHIAGIRCAACVQLIEFRVMQLAGVQSIRINPLSQRAQLVWDSEVLSLKSIIQAIVDLGYAAYPANQTLSAIQQKIKRLALWRIFVAGFAMMQVMMYAFPAYLVPVPQIDGDLTPDLDKLLKIASMTIAVPVILFSATPFFDGAKRDLRQRFVGMDVPVSLGILLTFGASCWAVFAGGAVYFDSAIMFVFLLLGARYIEDGVKQKTNATLSILTQIHPSFVQRMTSFPSRASTERIPTDEIKNGDFILVAPGEHIACDGEVVDGQSECDEAWMTGESHPVVRKVGDTLIAGAVNLHSVLVMRAERVGTQTQLSQMIAMMENASLAKPRIVQLADKHASRFLIAILLIAVMSGVAWSFFDPSRALWVAISVIVVTCPCALSLATPGVMSGAIGQMAKYGMLVTKGDAIESLANTTHVIFDKTGTLTHGRLRVTSSEYLAQSLYEEKKKSYDDLMTVIAASSRHPASIAVTDFLVFERGESSLTNGQVPIDDSTEYAGEGVEVNVSGMRYRFGKLDFVAALSGDTWQIPLAFQTMTVSVFGDENGIVRFFAMQDSLREDAQTAIAELQNSGKHIVLLSGDRVEVVRDLAKQCGISDFQAEMSPSGKCEWIRQLQSQGAKVAMVGDGMNDGPALSIADVSVAMGQGAPISQTRSDCLLMSNRLDDLSFAMKLAVKANRLIRENLMWALVYNFIAIPAAVFGYLEPWHAALGMTLSSLLVVLNGLRVLIMKPARVTSFLN